MHAYKFVSILLLLLPSSLVWSDTLENALNLFDFAETNYPELLSPQAPVVQEIQGFYVRHYTDTDMYLGVQGDNVFVLGGDYGPEVTYVGKVDNFIAVDASDISDAVLSNRRASCTYYADTSYSSVVDIKRGIPFSGNLEITVQENECVFTSNSIPNHDFNDDGASFANDVDEVFAEYRIPIAPEFAVSATAIAIGMDNGVLLNGVKVDILAAGCFGIGGGRIGCNDMSQPYRYDPMSPLSPFGTDSHNAHPQGNGAYHYHGNPMALFDQDGSVESPVVGFAADGFPIYGSFINDNGEIRPAESSYQLKPGDRPDGQGSPGGSFDGTFVADYEYVPGRGDLDECNRMTRNGVNGYFIINEYPWILKCFRGTPDVTFLRR